MKILSKIFGAALIASTLSACGSSNPSGTAAFGYGTTGVNGVQTSYAGPGGCVPLQTGTLTFTAQGAAMNNAYIRAGNLPMSTMYGGQYGQVTMGGSNLNGAGMIQYQPKTGPNGTLQITSSGTLGQGTVSGMVQLSAAAIQQLMMSTGGYMGGYANTYPGAYPNTYPNSYPGAYPGAYPQANTLCVSSIGLDIVQNVITNNNPYSGLPGQTGYNPAMQSGYGQIISAAVYLYLNNGQGFLVQL